MSNTLGWIPIADNDPIAAEKANDNFGIFDAAIAALTPGGVPWDFGFSFSATPSNGATILIIPVTRDIVVPFDMIGSVGAIDGDLPGADYDIEMTVDNSLVGAITIATDGSFSFTTIASHHLSIMATQVIRFVAPAPSSPPPTNVSVVILANLA